MNFQLKFEKKFVNKKFVLAHSFGIQTVHYVICCCCLLWFVYTYCVFMLYSEVQFHSHLCVGVLCCQYTTTTHNVQFICGNFALTRIFYWQFFCEFQVEINSNHRFLEYTFEFSPVRLWFINFRQILTIDYRHNLHVNFWLLKFFPVIFANSSTFRLTKMNIGNKW